MKKRTLLQLASAFILATNSLAGETSLLGLGPEPQIAIHNTILAKANGKPISVVDIMKKMDMLFYRQFPQYTSSVQARYQFYMANWKAVLSEMIDKELITADAEESKLQISAGDVRQEMEALFGPNIIENLDKIGLTFDEAYKMVLADITIRRMMYFRVQLKAISEATPQRIRDYYEKIAKDNIRDNEWHYQMITIRHKDQARAVDTAAFVHKMLTEDKVPLASLNDKLKETVKPSTRNPTVTVSEEYHTKEKELSDGFIKTLQAMTPGSYSIPMAQKSRGDNSTVVRIFYLKGMTAGGVVPFQELETRIKNQLIDEGMDRESKAYITKLRQHFDVQEDQLKALLNSDFQPFVLK